MKLKDTEIYINEDLTKINSNIFFNAQVLRKDKLIHRCRIVNGMVIAS